MSEFVTPYLLIQDALDPGDLEFLRSACKQYLFQEGIPCYVLINNLESPTFIKIKTSLEQRLGESLYYLNDFYIYTDSSFKTNWHMDTELFTFERAINAWILLSPDVVEDPLGFIDRINDGSERYFHSVRADGDKYVFGDYSTGKVTARSVESVEAESIHTPTTKLGDILLLNPKRFHRTNANVPKHALSLKFVLKGGSGFLSCSQVDPIFWPEVDIYNKLVKSTQTWEDVVDGIRRALKTETGRKGLSAGFYPEKFPLYRRMVASL